MWPHGGGYNGFYEQRCGYNPPFASGFAVFNHPNQWQGQPWNQACTSGYSGPHPLHQPESAPPIQRLSRSLDKMSDSRVVQPSQSSNESSLSGSRAPVTEPNSWYAPASQQPPPFAMTWAPRCHSYPASQQSFVANGYGTNPYGPQAQGPYEMQPPEQWQPYRSTTPGGMQQSCASSNNRDGDDTRQISETVQRNDSALDTQQCSSSRMINNYGDHSDDELRRGHYTPYGSSFSFHDGEASAQRTVGNQNEEEQRGSGGFDSFYRMRSFSHPLNQEPYGVSRPVSSYDNCGYDQKPASDNSFYGAISSNDLSANYSFSTNELPQYGSMFSFCVDDPRENAFAPPGDTRYERRHSTHLASHARRHTSQGPAQVLAPRRSSSTERVSGTHSASTPALHSTFVASAESAELAAPQSSAVGGRRRRPQKPSVLREDTQPVCSYATPARAKSSTLVETPPAPKVSPPAMQVHPTTPNEVAPSRQPAATPFDQMRALRRQQRGTYRPRNRQDSPPASAIGRRGGRLMFSGVAIT